MKIFFRNFKVSQYERIILKITAEVQLHLTLSALTPDYQTVKVPKVGTKRRSLLIWFEEASFSIMTDVRHARRLRLVF